MGAQRKVRLSAGSRVLLSAALIAFSATGLCPKAPGQVEPERPKFYALQIVSEKKVQDAKNTLGPPDGRYAEILPCGQLVLFMAEKLYSFPSAGGLNEGPSYFDSGSVLGQGGMDFSLEGWFGWRDEQGGQHYDWMPLGLSTSGFFLYASYPVKETAGVDMIRITNTGPKPLFIDAVVGLGGEHL
jgi:hypothetical protein